MIACFLRPSIGVNAPQNKARLWSLRTLVSLLKIPGLAVGDWNCTPEEFESAGWATLLQAEVVLPQGLVATCSTGRLLDFAVVSSTARTLC